LLVKYFQKKEVVLNVTAVFIDIFVLGLLVLSIIKSRDKTKQSLRLAMMAFMRTLPTVVMVIILIGVLMGFVSRETIANFVGKQSGFGGVLIIALIGAFLYVPSLIAFPLAASFKNSGASTEAVAAFITTLTMLGFLTLPVEIKELGKKMALLRNGFSFIVAIAIALLMGVIL
jgi:uncharacterized membrane protein YraQ (UPF0718 family)